MIDRVIIQTSEGQGEMIGPYGTWWVGRDHLDTVVLYRETNMENKNRIAGQHTSVSREHLCIKFSNGNVILSDNDSTNGSYLYGDEWDSPWFQVREVTKPGVYKLLIGSIEAKLICENGSRD